MELGIFSLTDLAGGMTLPARIRDIVSFGIRADQLGLDVFGIGEHHTTRFAVSSPAVVLAAVAAQSSSIRLTTTVSVLSVLDPVRLYQDFAQLDLVSEGRAEVTVGRSAYVEPFDLFGVPIDEYDAVFEEKVGLMLELRAGAPVTWAGRFRTPLDDARVVPRLDHLLPVWVGVGGTPASAIRAGRLGLPMSLALLSGSPARMRPVADAYREAARSHGHGPGVQVIAGVSHFFVGKTSQGAREAFYPHYRSYFADGRGIDLDHDTFEQMAAPNGPLVVGSAAEVAEKILIQRELLGIARFMGQVDLGGLPSDLVRASIDRFAEGVAPVVRRASDP